MTLVQMLPRPLGVGAKVSQMLVRAKVQLVSGAVLRLG